MAAKEDVDLRTGIEREILQCAICKETVRQPKLLPCLHSFCAVCLRRHTAGKDKAGDSFRCPLCQETVTLPPGGVDGLKDNEWMRDLSEVMDKVKPRCCMICQHRGQETLATHVCLTCGDSYCHDCSGIHTVSAALKEHRVVLTTDIAASNVSQELQKARPVLCSKHPEEMLTYYCTQCEAVLCRHCGMLGHRDHDWTTVSEARQEKAKQLQETLECLQKQYTATVNNITTLGDVIDSLRIEKEQKLNEINEQDRMLRKLLDTIKAKKVYLIQQTYDKQCEEIAGQAHQMETQVVNHTAAQSYAQSTLQHGGDVEFLHKLPMLTQRLKDLQKLCQPLETTCVTLKLCQSGDAQKLLEEALGDTDLVIKSGAIVLKSIDTRYTGDLGIRSLTWMADGNLAVVGQERPEVQVYNTMGDLLKCIKLDGVKKPECLTAYKKYLLIAERETGEMFKVDMHGKVMDTVFCVEADGFGSKQLNALTDNTGNMYISSYISNKVYMSSEIEDGEWHPFVPWDTHIPTPYDMCTHKNSVIVSSPLSHQVNCYTTKGQLMWTYGQEGKREGDFNKPCGVCVDHHGNIIIADRDNHRLALMSNTGHHLGYIMGEADDIRNPRAVTVSRDGDVVFSHQDKDRPNYHIKVIRVPLLYRQ